MWENHGQEQDQHEKNGLYGVHAWEEERASAYGGHEREELAREMEQECGWASLIGLILEDERGLIYRGE